MTTTKMKVMDKIAAGELDHCLTDIERLVKERLREVRSAQKTDSFGIGDAVVFNSFCGTEYMRGKVATVVGVRQKSLVVKTASPVGKFARYNEITDTWEPDDIIVSPCAVDLV